MIDYSSTKGAINSFTRSMAYQLAPRGIRVNAVAWVKRAREAARPLLDVLLTLSRLSLSLFLLKVPVQFTRLCKVRHVMLKVWRIGLSMHFHCTEDHLNLPRWQVSTFSLLTQLVPMQLLVKSSMLLSVNGSDRDSWKRWSWRCRWGKVLRSLVFSQALSALSNASHSSEIVSFSCSSVSHS